MTYESQLYSDLEALIASTNAFVAKDYQLHGRKYRLYDYLLPNWTEFHMPGGLDARGTVFDVTDAKPTLVCLPPQKFFNYAEGGVDHMRAQVGIVMDKRDGSLMSTYTAPDGSVQLKSRGTMDQTGDQVADAMRWLERNSEFKRAIHALTVSGYTVNMEWTSPLNRIVIPYQQPELSILSLRSTVDGHTVSPDQIDVYPDWLVDYYQAHGQTPNQIHDLALTLTDTEGSVVQLIGDDGTYYVKCKSSRYTLMHKNKDSICNPRALFELVLSGGSDDIRDLLREDTVAQNLVNQTEAHVFPVHNQICFDIDQFHCDHGHLDRKSYAMLAKQKHDTIVPLLMNRYLGKPADVKRFMIANYDRYRVKEYSF